MTRPSVERCDELLGKAIVTYSKTRDLGIACSGKVIEEVATGRRYIVLVTRNDDGVVGHVVFRIRVNGALRRLQRWSINTDPRFFIILHSI